MIKILTVFGTRPETIKMAPVIEEIGRHPLAAVCKVCVTGQHRQMIDPLLKLFGIQVHYDLNIMQENQSLEHITVSILEKMKDI